MTDKLQIAGNHLPDKPENTTVTQVSHEGVQVGSVENLNYNQNNILITGNNARDNIAMNNLAIKGVSREYFNLFVIGAEDYQNSFFVVPKDRALTEHMTEKSKAMFSPLTQTAIETIKTLPTIFASENTEYGSTSPDHQAFYGFVTDVREALDGYRIYFKLFQSISQQRLNELAIALDLSSSTHFNELNRTHWSIKNIDLVEELRQAGVYVFTMPTGGING